MQYLVLLIDMLVKRINELEQQLEDDDEWTEEDEKENDLRTAYMQGKDVQIEYIPWWKR